MYETHSESGKGWHNTGTWSQKSFYADYTKCTGGDCYDGQTEIGPFDHYPGSPNYTGYTTWIEDNTQYVKTSYSTIVNEYPEKVEYNLNSGIWTEITSNLGSGTTSITISADQFVQGVNTIQFRDSNTYSTKLEWTLYINQGATSQEYITTFSHDVYGNLTSIVDPKEHTTTFTYSAGYGHAYPTSITNAEGATVSAVYDFAAGTILSVTAPEGYTTSYQYDLLGRVTKIINPDSSEKRAVYDDDDNSITLYDEFSHYVRGIFDGCGRVTRIEYFMNDQFYAAETYTYDYQNKKVTHTDPLGSMYHYEYDSRGRLVEITNPDSTSRTAQYDDISNTVTFSDENQHTKKMRADWKNRLLWVQEFTDSSTYYFTQYEYDQAGNLVWLTDANQNTTHYEYNSLFGPTRITYPDGTAEQFTYDEMGNLTSKTDANGNVITFSYNDISQITQMIYPGGMVSFEYDLNGNRTSMTDPAGTSVYSYDNRDRLISETRTINGIEYVIQSEYDAASRLISMTYPDGTALTFEYDDLNRLIAIPGYAQYEYNLKSQVQHMTYQNGVETDITYGCLCGRPTEIHAEKNGSELLNLFYTYDPTGNVTQREKSIFNPETNTLETFNEFYSYDWLNRLTSFTNDTDSSTYGYDGAGNRVSADGIWYTYNTVNELVSVTDGTTFSYDLNGNVVTKAGSSTWEYQYDTLNQLTQVLKDGESVDQYTYDGDGKRIQKTEWIPSLQSFQNTVYVYTGLNIFYEKNTTTGMDAVSIHGPTGRIARKAGDTTFYYHTDHLGSTQMVTDENGTVVTSVNYSPFGVHETKGEPEKYLLTGKEEDASHLYYFGARYYDPAVGRFTTRDSELGELTHPQSLNKYTYCLNNPLSYRDVWGLSASGGSDDCDCASDPEVQGLLQDLETVNQQIQDLEEQLQKDAEQLLKTEKDRIRCIEVLKENLSLDSIFNKIFDYIPPIKGLPGWLIALLIPRKLLLLAGETIIYIWFVSVTGNTIYCAFHYNNKSSLHKSIRANTIMLEAKRKQKAGILENLWNKCPCAVPEEEGGHQSGGSSIT